VISDDPRAEFLARLTRSLGGSWWERRRIVRELEHHLEDCVADLKQTGMPEGAAVQSAMTRLGDVDAIVGAVRATRSSRRLSWQSVTRVPIAWIAVGAMSIVTLAAAELPQVSGAQATKLEPAPPTHVQVRPSSGCLHAHRSPDRKVVTHRGHLPRACRCC
jgi:hypothetical protein